MKNKFEDMNKIGWKTYDERRGEREGSRRRLSAFDGVLEREVLRPNCFDLSTISSLKLSLFFPFLYDGGEAGAIRWVPRGEITRGGDSRGPESSFDPLGDRFFFSSDRICFLALAGEKFRGGGRSPVELGLAGTARGVFWREETDLEGDVGADTGLLFFERLLLAAF